jgi:hypothetical protein
MQATGGAPRRHVCVVLVPEHGDDLARATFLLPFL